jgi:hypothetical protein
LSENSFKLKSASRYQFAFLFLKANKGIFLLIISLVLTFIFSLSPQLGDLVFRNLIFRILRFICDHTIGLLPFPFVYVLIPAIPFLLYIYIRKFPIKKSTFVFLPVNLIGWMYTLFMWMWGFNYCCSPVFTPTSDVRIEVEELHSFGRSICNQLNSEFSENQFAAADSLRLSQEDIGLIRSNVQVELSSLNHYSIGNPSFYEVELDGVMRKLGIAGIYMPFTAEAHGDGSYLRCTRVFIAAHELSHAYGVTSEAEADYVAYRSLKNAPTENREFHYYAELELLRSVRYQLHLLNDTLRIELDSSLNQKVLDDLHKIKTNALKYTEIFPGMQEAMNDKYLKLMGVQDGIKNYDKFVDLAWRDWKSEQGKINTP